MLLKFWNTVMEDESQIDTNKEGEEKKEPLKDSFQEITKPIDCLNWIQTFVGSGFKLLVGFSFKLSTYKRTYSERKQRVEILIALPLNQWESWASFELLQKFFKSIFIALPCLYPREKALEVNPIATRRRKTPHMPLDCWRIISMVTTRPHASPFNQCVRTSLLTSTCANGR